MTPSDSAKRHELAGLALRNGVLIIGPSRWGVAIREPDGGIRAASGDRPFPGRTIAARLPILRGPVRLAGMMATLPAVRRAMPQVRFGFESRELLATSIGTSLLLGSLRRALTRRAGGRLPSAQLAMLELGSSLASLAIMSVAMRGGDVARYHGAEHKAVRGYELGISAAEAPKEHPRCGTQLALPMIVASAIGTQVGLAAAPGHPQPARLAGSLAGIGVASEVTRAGLRDPDHPVAGPLARAGLSLQRHATTAEPDPEQLEVAEAALEALLAVEPAPTGD